MQHVRLGRTNLRVSRLGLGAMGFGDRSWRGWVLDAAAARPIVARALDLGITFFDTCDFYSAGRSEEILGEVLVGAVPRAEIVLATKAGNPMGRGPNARGFSRKHLVAALDASLKRLRTDHVDLFQTHVWNPDTDLDELVDTFDDLIRAGKTLYAGATTMPAWSFATAVHLAERRGLHRFVSMQCEYNPAHREAERELIPFCRAAGIGLVPFSPIARGFLAADRRLPANRDLRTETDDYTAKHYGREADFAVWEALARVAERHGVSPARVAVAWTAGRPGITAPIFGAESPEHVEEAVAALGLALTDEDRAEIEGAYAPRPIHLSGH